VSRRFTYGFIASQGEPAHFRDAAAGLIGGATRAPLRLVAVFA